MDYQPLISSNFFNCQVGIPIMIIETIEAKTIAKRTTIDDWWWSEASMNPYRGCWHDCIYCDGKSEGYHIHEDFGTRIKGKSNAPQLFAKFLQKQGFFPIHKEKTSTLVDFFPSTRERVAKQQPGKFIVSIGGGVCDVYQKPAEKKLNITRKLLQVACDYNFPVQLLTKSNLVLRDIDLLKKLPYANVSFSITLADAHDQKNIEPRASTTPERFDAIKQLREEGIHAGVLFLPVLPWIGDTDENMDSIFSQAEDVAAEYVVVGGLTLKPGRQKVGFFQMLQENYPTLLPKYEILYGNNDRWGSPDHSQIKELNLENATVKAFEISKNYKLPLRMPRYLPEGRIKNNLRISTILFRIAYFKTLYPPIWRFTSDFRKAAVYIDTYSCDLHEISKQELNKLPIPKKVMPYVIELLETGECRLLRTIGEDQNLFYE